MKLCDEEDCINYKSNTEEQDSDFTITSTSGEKLQFKVSDSVSFIILNNLEIPIACLLCSYRKDFDMKEILIVNKAKRLLNE